MRASDSGSGMDSTLGERILFGLTLVALAWLGGGLAVPLFVGG